MNTHPLAESNIAFLRQGVELLESISDDLFLLKRPPVFSSHIGGHLRHAFDHMALFAAHWASGRIDYDARVRKTRVETDRRACSDALGQLIPEFSKVTALRGGDRISVKMDCGEDGGASVSPLWAESTVARELQFLVSHTVHHYALISMILQLEGQNPTEGFGYAPATLKYLKDTAKASA